MKLRNILSVVLVSLIGAASGAWIARSTYRDGKTVHRYAIQTQMANPYAGRRLLGWLAQNEFDVAGFDWQSGTIEVITDDDGIDVLNKNGLKGIIRKTQQPGQRPIGANAVDPQYLNPQKVETALKALNERYPQLTRLEQIGTSNEGRPIWALLISTTPARGAKGALDKPSILFDGMHHAREVMTSEIVFDVAQNLLESQSRSRIANTILSRWNVWVVPMLNVDGNARVWNSDSWWRKNARAQGNWVHGVDINRNYPYGWNTCSGSSGSRMSDSYRGLSGASEPETQALVKLAQLARPAASLSYHSYGELVLYPYGCNGVVTGENALHEKLGKELAAVLPSDSNRGTYAPGTPWQLLYSVDGDSMSYMHSEFGAVAFTFEVNQEFQPRYALREPTLIKHRKAWQYFLQRIDANLLTVKVVDAAGSPIGAKIEFSTIPHQRGEKDFRTNEGGNLFKVLDVGTYHLRVTSDDGRIQQISVNMSGTPQAVTVAMPGRLAPRTSATN